MVGGQWVARRLASGVAGLAVVAMVAAGGSPSAYASASGGGRIRPDVGFGTTAVAAAGMSAVSCVGASFCMAVGSYRDPSGTARPLAEAWNGKAWRAVATPGAGLSSVSCVSARFCVAVGGTDAVTWDGAQWHAMPGSSGGTAVSCSSSSFCMVVRTTGADSWNGKNWRRLPLTIRYGLVCSAQNDCYDWLAALSCTSRSFCMTVGGLGFTNTDDFPSVAVAERWNGVKWSQISIPSPDYDEDGTVLNGMSCTSATFCLAVGWDDAVLTWYGQTWRTIGQLDYNTNLPVDSCAARNRCYLFNGSSTFESWTNGTLQTLASPAAPPASGISLPGLSCTGIASTQCTAAGAYSVSVGGENMTLAEQWTGAQWQVKRTTSPGDLFDGLSGVSCLGASFCMAVGSYHTAADTEKVLAEEWNGHRWRLLSAASPGTQVNYLASVSCPTTSLCVAVGSSDYQTGHWQTLAEEWNGTSWKILTTLNPGPNNDLTSISCPSTTNCMAVGSSRSFARAYTGTLAEQWNGASWTVLATPDPGSVAPTPQFNVLSGVSCTRPTWCMAVGDIAASGPLYSGALAIVWNGTSWKQVPATNPGGNMEFDAVSCTSTSRCVAAGQYVHGGNPANVPQAGDTIKPAADIWNGTSWTVHQPPALASGQTGQLNGIACGSRSECMAVGEYITSSGDVRELADSWNNHSWRPVKVTSLSSLFSDLFGVTCDSASRCMAVGQVAVQRTMSAQWNGSTWRSQNAVNP